MTNAIKMDKLIIGIGNSGRRDDGLGWAFLDAIAPTVDRFELVYRYQLNIEDAEMISRAATVIFVDATAEVLDKGFSLEKCQAKPSFEFTTHALEPGVILGLCHEVYGVYPEALTLKIQGNEWELREGLGQLATANLLKAIEVFESKLSAPDNLKKIAQSLV